MLTLWLGQVMPYKIGVPCAIQSKATTLFVKALPSQQVMCMLLWIGMIRNESVQCVWVNNNIHEMCALGQSYRSQLLVGPYELKNKCYVVVKFN